jgi:hypothetical protein
VPDALRLGLLSTARINRRILAVRGQTDAVEVGRRDAEIVKLAHGVGLHVDADAERAHLAHRLEDDAGHADLVQRQGGGEAADAAAGDENGSIGHAGPVVRSLAVGSRVPLSLAERAEQAPGGSRFAAPAARRSR